MSPILPKGSAPAPRATRSSSALAVPRDCVTSDALASSTLTLSRADNRNGDFCASDALNTIQNTTGIDVTFNTVTSLLGGDGSVAERLQQALGTGQLCTGCVAK